MEISISFDADRIIEALDKWTVDMENAIMEGLNTTVERTRTYAQMLASERLINPEGYNASFYWIPAQRIGAIYTAFLGNSHQWVEAIESGTPPHFGGPYGFRVGPHRPPYPWRIPADKKGWRTFYQHYGARPFWILRDAVEFAQSMLSVYLDEAFSRVRT